MPLHDQLSARSSLGAVSLIGVSGYRPESKQLVHAHNFASIALVLHGAVKETHRSREEMGSSLSIVFKPIGYEHADHYGPSGCRILQLRLTEERARSLPDDAVWHHRGGQALRAFASLIRLAEAPGPAAPDDFELILADLLAGLSETPINSRRPPRWLVDIKEELDESEIPSVPVGTISANAGVHPVYLTRMFRSYFGCSIREYVKCRRIRAAAALLSHRQLRIADIAQRLWFADQAHLCRQFREFAHLSPRGYRRLLDRGEMV